MACPDIHYKRDDSDVHIIYNTEHPSKAKVFVTGTGGHARAILVVVVGIDFDREVQKI
jgi:hypothetical protein